MPYTENMIHKSQKKGFTLIELLIVMILMSILALLLVGNYMSSLKKGRDSKRKSDLNQIQRAMEMYYEDYSHYPVLTDGNLFGKSLCSDSSCQVRTYMVKVPQDPNADYTYHYAPGDATASPQSYYLFSAIENNQDQSQNVNVKGYSGVSCGTGILCRYYVSSSNAATPATNP